MLRDGRFWFGVAVGVGGCYAWKMYKMKSAPAR